MTRQEAEDIMRQVTARMRARTLSVPNAIKELADAHTRAAREQSDEGVSKLLLETSTTMLRLYAASVVGGRRRAARSTDVWGEMADWVSDKLDRWGWP
jgi:hypothetical protein